MDAKIVCHTKWDESTKQYEFSRAEWIGGKRAGISVELVAVADPVFLWIDPLAQTIEFGDLKLKIVALRNDIYEVERVE